MSNDLKREKTSVAGTIRNKQKNDHNAMIKKNTKVVEELLKEVLNFFEENPEKISMTVNLTKFTTEERLTFFEIVVSEKWGFFITRKLFNRVKIDIYDIYDHYDRFMI